MIGSWRTLTSGPSVPIERSHPQESNLSLFASYTLYRTSDRLISSAVVILRSIQSTTAINAVGIPEMSTEEVAVRFPYLHNDGTNLQVVRALSGSMGFVLPSPRPST